LDNLLLKLGGNGKWLFNFVRIRLE
jgi:hypothetical protein